MSRLNSLTPCNETGSPQADLVIYTLSVFDAQRKEMTSRRMIQ